MRKPLLIALIAATALVPVAASAQDWQGRRNGRGNGVDAPRAEHQPRADRGVRAEGRFEGRVEGRGGFDRRQTSAPPAQRADAAPAQSDVRSRPGFGDAQADFRRARRPDDADRGSWRGRRDAGDGQVAPTQPQQRADVARPATEARGRPGFGDARGDFDRARRWDRAARADRTATPQARDDRRDRAADVRRPDRGWNGDARADGRNGWNTDRNRDWNDRNWNGRNGYRNDNRFAGQGWNRGWRGDNRYDWQGWRQRNRQAYRLPRYYAPQGYHYGYQRFSIGLTLGAMLYSRNYWIDDPWQYRLPDVYGPYRWVRYYNDALLVDIYSGEVVDVINDIFW